VAPAIAESVLGLRSAVVIGSKGKTESVRCREGQIRTDFNDITVYNTDGVGNQPAAARLLVNRKAMVDICRCRYGSEIFFAEKKCKCLEFTRRRIGELGLPMTIF